MGVDILGFRVLMICVLGGHTDVFAFARQNRVHAAMELRITALHCWIVTLANRR
ncbi:hypothetical protein BIW11_02860 [Tropilaelaps mercedesae]|uniref:Uncharacterized protein n=1 Tax=Tropilaelaps mercedesae TaxID=418985 RepID=A0A1V9XWI1_9ACAR|nr:hypothetical protein BIW11_02860 [Tropilaelaps mercedesae]